MPDDEKRSPFREFYEERLSGALWWGPFLTVVLTPLMFLMRWGGYRGKFKPWGDPIPFAEALSEVPWTAAVVYVGAVIGLAIFRPWLR